MKNSIVVDLMHYNFQYLVGSAEFLNHFVFNSNLQPRYHHVILADNLCFLCVSLKKKKSFDIKHD